MKNSYHHGNLRDTLLSKSIEILNDKGLKGLSVRAVAKLAGVSEAAPYSHFKNKDKLLEAIAIEGYEKLRQSLDEMTELTRFEMIERLAIGYVSFALENVQLFRLMFGRELAELTVSERHREASAMCYEPLSLEVSKLLDNKQSGLTVEAATTSTWSIVHGLSILLIDGKVPFPTDRQEQQHFIANRCHVITLALS
ncbi:TetR/AcrR family transcriptional regulator [Marinomonas sp. C2222]|uniref:TetR/AcrR family transcriptional regulator n=1 Tax=Marinomonas sargassi TaxID=2984494 RepID=A0ABT2YRL9_9GAMM|nr:TetR/AcrR family transcriptional regulator [Marinomonas sargassi]MCV2402516.1 TetR/AcrR family transcriptional regulator [Marinomonas sargassi]